MSNNKRFPFVMKGRKLTPFFFGIMGPILMSVGALLIWLTISEFSSLVVFQRIVIPILSSAGMAAGVLFVYQLLQKFPYRTVFTADEMVQHFIIRTQVQPMHDIVKIRRDHVTRLWRRQERKFFRITFTYRDGSTFEWIPNEFDFPLAYYEFQERENVEEWFDILVEAYLPDGTVTQSEGK